MTMKTNKQYEREDDARTLLRAEEIRNDKKRLRNATEELKKQQQAAMDALYRTKGSDMKDD